MKRLVVGICIVTFTILSWQCSKAKDTIKQMEAALASANQTNTATSSDTLYVSQAVDSIEPSTVSNTSASTSVTTTLAATAATTATLATTSVDSAGNTSVQVTSSSSTGSSSSSSSGSSSGVLVGPTVTDVVTVTILSTDIQTETAPTRLEKIAQLIYNQVPKKYNQMLTKLEFIGAMLKIRDMHKKHNRDDDDNKTLSGKRLVKIVGCLSDQFTQFQNSNQMLTFTALEALLLANAPNIMEYRKYFYYHHHHRGHYEHNCGNLYSVFRELVDRESHYFAIPGLRNFSDSHQDDEWQSGYMGPGGWLPGRWNNPFNTDVSTQTEVNVCQPNIGTSCKADTDCNACVSVPGHDSLTMMTTVQCVNSKCQRTGCPILPPPAGMMCTGCTGNSSCIPAPVFGSSSGTGTPVTSTGTSTTTGECPPNAMCLPTHTLPIIHTAITTATATASATSTATSTSTTTSCTPNVNKSCSSNSQCNQCISGYTPGSNSNSIPAAVDCINRKCTQVLSNGCPINFTCSSNKQCVCTTTSPCRCQ